MKPHPSYVTPHRYTAYNGRYLEGAPLLCEAPSLRDLITQLQVFQVDVLKLHINAEIEKWDMHISVPYNAYTLQKESGIVLQPVDVVAEHWDFPGPYAYLAVDFKHGIWVESPTLHGIVEQLRQAGHSFVYSSDMKIAARFAREDSDIDDVVQVPLSSICYDYDPEDEDVFEIDDEEAEECEGFEDMMLCSRLPKKAELADVELFQPHFLFGALIIEGRRAKQLLMEK